MTFCALIKQHFPHIHVTIGGNTVTRLRDVLPESPLFQYFDSAVVYEGETAFVQLVEAVGAKRSLADVPNTIYKDDNGRACLGHELMPRTWRHCRRRISTGCRWRSILCRRRSCRIWRRADAIGAAASSATMARAIRPATGRRRFRTFWPRSSICATSTARSIFISPTNRIRRRSFESWRVVWSRVRWASIWTTHMRFEKSLLEDDVWQDAKDSGCRYLHFGYESGVRARAEVDGQGDDDRDHDEASEVHGGGRHLEPLHGLLRLPWRNERGSLAVGRVSRSRTRTMSIRSGSARSTSAGITRWRSIRRSGA